MYLTDPNKNPMFSYSSIRNRPKITWPSGANIAVWVIPNLEVFALNEVIQGSNDVPNVPGYSRRDYGNRVGVFRIIDIMKHFGVRGTVALNANYFDYCPEVIEEVKLLGWELMGHNETNTIRLNDVDPLEEERIIQNTSDKIKAFTGTAPVGWLGSGLTETWHTVENLCNSGYIYVSDWVNDDQPYLMDVNGKKLVSMNYSLELNDKPAFEQSKRTPDEFLDMIKRQFDVLYHEGSESGRVLGLALHPYLTGLPYRVNYLRDALAYMSSHEKVWFATGSEIAQHYRSQVGA